MDMSGDFTHLDRHGHAHMVDVNDKAVTLRRATTKCLVVGLARTLPEIGGESGDNEVLSAARVAGVQAAKATSSLIPLCHPLPLTALSIDFAVRDDALEISATVETMAKTGVEMEALTACAVAALTVLGAARGRDPEASIEQLTLWNKSGGRSGQWRRIGAGALESEPTA
jgi:cyclic pyranopterin phosphate synthase